MQATVDNNTTPSSASLTAETSDILCRCCQNPLYSKVTNAATAQSGKSWRCAACLQLFTVKSSAKRHVTNSHKDPVCRGCQEGNPAAAPTMANGAMYGNSTTYSLSTSATKTGVSAADGSSMDPDEDDPDEEIDLEPELALLTLMLKNHLDLKGVDSVLELLNGGMDFSGIQNASHWLQRLGKHAAVQYTTTNCPNCKRTEVQIKVDQTSGSASEGQTMHPVILAAGGSQMNQGPGMGTVLGVFDPSSGQLYTSGNVNLDKNTLQKVNTMVNINNVPGQLNGIRIDGQQVRGVIPVTYTNPGIATSVTVSPPKKKKKGSSKAKASAGNQSGANTSWKAVARTFLYSLHTKDELLRLCVVGRRMDRTSALGLQPMDVGKRKIVGDAVAEHCIKAGIPVPPDTLLNHFMSQILCDSRRKEQLMVCGGELQPRPPKKIKTEMDLSSLPI